jgi:hypothetical protein
MEENKTVPLILCKQELQSYDIKAHAAIKYIH